MIHIPPKASSNSHLLGGTFVVLHSVLVVQTDSNVLAFNLITPSACPQPIPSISLAHTDFCKNS